MGLNIILQPQRHKLIKTNQNTLPQMILYQLNTFAHYARASRNCHNVVAVTGRDLIQHHFHAFSAVFAAQCPFNPEDFVRLIN
jgi:hypothetical protein